MLCIGPGTSTSTLTYVAQLNVAKFGRKFAYSDIDIIQLGNVVSKITPKTKAILAVHLYGNPVWEGLVGFKLNNLYLRRCG